MNGNPKARKVLVIQIYKSPKSSRGNSKYEGPEDKAKKVRVAGECRKNELEGQARSKPHLPNPKGFGFIQR